MIFNRYIIKKEFHTLVLTKSFYVFFLIFSFLTLFAFYNSGFFSEIWYPIGTYMSIGFIISLFFSAYAGYLSSVVFAREFEYNTIRSLITHTSREQVFWSKNLSVIAILCFQTLLLLIFIAIIGSVRGTLNIYFIILFLQILTAIYIFSLGAYSIALLTAIILRRISYPLVISVMYGLLTIIGFFILSANYSPGITYLCLDYSYLWSPIHYIPYVIFSTVEWGFVPIILIIAPLMWIIPVILLAGSYFRRCDI